MDKQIKEKALALARKSIKNYLEEGDYLEVEDEDYPEDFFSDTKGVFVTLKKKGELRGCIGNITTTISVLNSIIRNSMAAAFKDPRFPELEEDELDEIEITISFLEQPMETDYYPTDKFIAKLNEEKPGVIIRKGFRQATFLPAVWEEISDPEKFMEALCKKADLKADIWKSRTPGLVIELYTSESISE